MSLITRFVNVVKAKFNKFLSTQEDPIEQLEYAYTQMEEKRKSVKESVVDVMSQRKKLESKRDGLQEEVEAHNQDAKECMKAGREDLARVALEKKKSKMAAVEGLEEQIGQMETLEEDMQDQLTEIENRLNELKTEKEVLKARYQGAEAVEAVNESLTENLGDYSIEDAVGDVEEEIQDMEARASAINEFNENENESIEEQIDSVTTGSSVDAELDTLRSEIGEVEETIDDVNAEIDAAEEEAEHEVSVDESEFEHRTLDDVNTSLSFEKDEAEKEKELA